MSQVTASEVYLNKLLANGRRRIRYKYTIEDNLLNTADHITPPFHRPGAWDVQGNLAAYADAYLEGLKTDEVLQIHELALTPDDEIDSLSALQTEIFARTDAPLYTIKKRVQKKLMYYFIRRADSQYAWNVKLVYDDLPAADSTLRARLDLSPAQLTKFRSKASEFYELPLSIKSGVQILDGAFTTESDDWGDPG